MTAQRDGAPGRRSALTDLGGALAAVLAVLGLINLTSGAIADNLTRICAGLLLLLVAGVLALLITRKEHP